MKVLMVCLGNICRSPLAEGILKHKCAQNGLDWYIDSEFDLIFAMDISNYKDLLSWALDKTEENKVKLILNELYPNENRSVPDPYFDDSGFQTVFEMLDKACDKIIEKYA